MRNAPLKVLPGADYHRAGVLRSFLPPGIRRWSVHKFMKRDCLQASIHNFPCRNSSQKWQQSLPGELLNLLRSKMHHVVYELDHYADYCQHMHLQTHGTAECEELLQFPSGSGSLTALPLSFLLPPPTAWTTDRSCHIKSHGNLTVKQSF